MKRIILLCVLPLLLILSIPGCDPNGGSGDDINIPGDDDGSGSRLAIQSPTALDLWNNGTSTLQSGLSNGHLGSRVAISRNGNVIAAGNYRDDRERNDDSSVFIYYPVSIYRSSGSSWNRYNVRPSDTSLDLSAIDFGWSLAISNDGNVVAIGSKLDGRDYTAPGGGTEYLNTGAVYIYRWNGTEFVESEKITPPIAAAEYPQRNMQFGTAVSLSGDGSILAVGAPKFDTSDNYSDPTGISLGRVFVFRYNGAAWDADAPIDAVNAANHQRQLNFFGYSIAISADGNRIVAGARKDPGDGIAGETGFVYNAGSAYILTFNPGNGSWTQVKLLAPDRSPDDYFGHSVGISGDGDTVVVGSNRSDPKGIDSGAVYAYSRAGNGWSTPVKLFSVYGDDLDQLAYSVAVSNDGSHIAAGYGMDGGDQSYGRISVFSKDPEGTYAGNNPWNHENILWAGNRSEGDFFGRGVGISGSGSIVAAGVPALTKQGNSGRVLVFR